MSHKRRPRIASVAALASLSVLSGCASFSGQQRALAVADLQNGYAKLVSDPAFTTYARELDPDVKKALRNVIVLRYLMAVDDRYDDFTANLSKELRGSNLGFDIALLALTGVGSMVTNAAPELSAVATGVGGARSSFNKELYVERTLPAILVVMDTNRLRIRTSIQDHLRLNAADYSLEEAMLEVREYERAGNLNRAITNLTSQASVAFAAAERSYVDAKPSCEPQKSLEPIRRQINTYLYKVVAKINFAAPTKDESDAIGRLATFLTNRGAKPVTKATSASAVDGQIMAALDLVTATCSEAETLQAKTEIMGAP